MQPLRRSLPIALLNRILNVDRYTELVQNVPDRLDDDVMRDCLDILFAVFEPGDDRREEPITFVGKASRDALAFGVPAAPARDRAPL